MRKLFTLILSLFITISAFADKGMWPPFMFKNIQKDLKAAGLKLKVDDLYSEDKSSLKDAIVIFGGGCTGEVISSQGLVLTNHHCGYGTVQGLSSMENNYLLDGYFAKSQKDEIPCPGLKVTFIKSYQDVTNKVLLPGDEKLDSHTRDSLVAARITAIVEEYKGDKDYEYEVSNFYQGNQYWLIKKEIYRDIRLVAFPPNGIGKFGGDTDNWAWPRHTGDFSMFRIYATPENKPSEYDKNNVPYKPKKFLEINLDAPIENDYTMIYGFPGRTEAYVSSAQLNSIMHTIDPTRIECRETILDVWNPAMELDQEVFLKYARKQASLANYWKKWIGEVQGLERNNALEKKKETEKVLKSYLASKNNSASEFDELEKLFTDNDALLKAYYYYIEALRGMELPKFADKLKILDLPMDSQVNRDSLVDKVKEYAKSFYKNYEYSLDIEVSRVLMNLYKKNVAADYQIDFVANNAQVGDYVVDLYKSSKMHDETAFDALMKKYLESGDFKIIQDEPMYALYEDIENYYKENIETDIKEFVSKRNMWNKNVTGYYYDWSQSNSRPLFPDANFTLRLTYGKSKGVDPQDGMHYNLNTTAEGIYFKYDSTKSEFDAPIRLIDMIKKKDFGRYAVNGELPVCFLASNHTTGGNSGSPVLDKKGRLIGLNFDRIWEGTMSDLNYDPNICRNIAVNIRYILFVVDKFGGAPWIVDELEICSKGFK